MASAKAGTARAGGRRAPKSDRLDVGLYGATGFTGRLATNATEKAGLDFLLGGRDETRLKALAAELGGEHPYLAARHDDPTALRALAERVQVLISTAGPFAEIGELTIAAAIDAGTHYLDSTGETEFMAQTFRRHHEQAKKKGVVVINACAFEYVIGDCAVALALEAAPEAKEVRVSYWLPDKSMTHGTALTALRAFAGGGDVAPAPEGRPGRHARARRPYLGGLLSWRRGRVPAPAPPRREDHQLHGHAPAGGARRRGWRGWWVARCACLGSRGWWSAGSTAVRPGPRPRSARSSAS